jgi:uncharacterized protein (TIGR04222 family)
MPTLQRFALVPRWLAAPALIALLAPFASIDSVAARALVIQSFDATVRVESDGGIVVTETIHPRFEGSWNGIYRTIPVQYRTPQGFNKTLFLDVEGATDGNGTALRVAGSRERHYRKLKIWIPGAQDAVRTVVLTYRVPNGLLFFEDHDELYWNITGDEWEVPIEAVTATIQLPAGVTGVRTLAFTGAYGSREHDADVQVNSNVVELRMRRELAFHEGMTVVVGWDKGFVALPSRVAQTWRFARSNWPFVIPVLAFVILYRLWWKIGRDPRRRPIAVQYEPPAALTPGELGTLVDNRPDLRDITATLVDLAVRGYLIIEEKKEQKLLGLRSSTSYVFEKRTPPASAATLMPHEEELLAAVFKKGDRVGDFDLENEFYKALPRIRDRIYEALVAKRFYRRRPDRVQSWSACLAIFGGILLFWAGIGLSHVLGVSPLPWVLAAVLSAIIGLVFARVMPARTYAGVRALEGALGFEEFLGRVDRDRFERVVKTPELFEKYLPYAMCLGVEKRWVAAFDDICKQPPDWYRGPGAVDFRPTLLAAHLEHMSSRTATAMASSPRSSGSSGFGGGGSSGGGGGGGGGGGF